jgi:hypothetical protein
MNFKNFAEFREFIRRYNSTSILEIGTERCWRISEITYENSLDWVRSNAERNHIIRLILLSSAGNPYRSKIIDLDMFNNLIYAYYDWDSHTISDQSILAQEVKIILDSIKKWEEINAGRVRSWSLKLSEILDINLANNYVGSLFLQRLVAFQSAGYGKQVSRITRTLKFIDLLDRRPDDRFSHDFVENVGLSPKTYFRHFLVCLSLFGNSSGKRRGYLSFSELHGIDEIKDLGIDKATIKNFIEKNSASFSTQSDSSFRSKLNKSLTNITDCYQPFFCNHFLETPLVKLDDENFCLPDPFSFTESCWNRVRTLMSKDNDMKKKLEKSLSQTFEDYLEYVLFPAICPNSFEKIPEVENPTSSKDKRADFLIRTSNSYIIVECKSSLMSSDTSAYFDAEKLADLWCRVQIASEQISMTVKALNLDDKPVIPLVMTFYDSIAASAVFEEMLKQTRYCSCMNFTIPPVVRSLHEFEHWTSDRSLDNWAELTLSNCGLKSDKRGHNYIHLSDISII